jgi:hypothetical protein
VALAGLGAMTVALAAGLSQSQALAAAAPEPAATTASGFVVHAGKLVLKETGGHYLGTLPITARNTGDTAVSSANLHLALPPGLRLITVSDNLGGCTGGTTGTADCTFFGPLDAGATAALSVTFGSYAGPERRARILDTGTVSLSMASTPGRQERASFTGLLAGRNGSTAHPRPYRPATTYDATLAQAGAVTVTALPDGGRSIRVPLIAGYRTDAANDLLELSSTVPDGVQRDGVDPPQPCFAICPVPGGFVAKGDTRDFAALFTLPAQLPTGTYTISLRVDSDLAGTFQTDRKPNDNTVLVTVTA